MKKALLSFMFGVLATIGFAQEHMKFAGIPLDGTIAQFQQKLLAKGYTLNSKMNSYLPVGTRSFKGTFIGKRANVAVYYDEATHIVYGAKAYFDELTETKAKEEKDDIESLLKQKYPDAYETQETTNGYPSFTLYTELGNIFVYLRKNEDLTGYPYHFSLHMEYHDSINGSKHHNNIMDDL